MVNGHPDRIARKKRPKRKYNILRSGRLWMGEGGSDSIGIPKHKTNFVSGRPVDG